jgi:hypothetical protein
MVLVTEPSSVNVEEPPKCARLFVEKEYVRVK